MKLYIADTLYYATQDEAKKAAKAKGCSWFPAEVPTKQADLVAHLNKLVHTLAHAVAAEVQMDMAVAQPTEVTITGGVSHPANGYAHQSVEIDEVWADLPLARQLHFASLAMEEARTVLPQLQHAADTASVL